MLVVGDARRIPLRDGSVQCVVTSPPYYSHRDYGLEPLVWGGDESCEHEWGAVLPPPHPGPVEQMKWKTAEAVGKGQTAASGGFCLRCFAWRGSLGLEPTPSLYVEHLVEVFRDVRRVLRDDGTLWLNLGDSYAGSWGNQGRKKERGMQRPVNGPMLQAVHDDRYPDRKSNTGAVPSGLKPKDMVGIPWRVAFALQADGWYLRRDIIWAKPNPMPESTRDRCTSSHEYLFHFAKSERYYYDHEAVKEPYTNGPGWIGRTPTRRLKHNNDRNDAGGRARSGSPIGRNKRSVWTIATKPYKGAHFAAFPPALVEPCVLAGTSERGACPACGAPWRRVMERTVSVDAGRSSAAKMNAESVGLLGRAHDQHRRLGQAYQDQLEANPAQTVGWVPTCGEYEGKLSETDPQAVGRRILLNVKAARVAGEPHDHPFPSKVTIGWEKRCGCDGEPVPCVVLDPFAGAGTVGLVCRDRGRSFVGVDLNPAYVGMARERLAGVVEPAGRKQDAVGKRTYVGFNARWNEKQTIVGAAVNTIGAEIPASVETVVVTGEDPDYDPFVS